MEPSLLAGLFSEEVCRIVNGSIPDMLPCVQVAIAQRLSQAVDPK